MSKLTSVARAFQFGTAVAILVFTQSSVLAVNSQVAKNEATLSRFKTCGAANKASLKNLRTRVGFTPRGAKRSFDADKDGVSCSRSLIALVKTGAINCLGFSLAIITAVIHRYKSIRLLIQFSRLRDMNAF